MKGSRPRGRFRRVGIVAKIGSREAVGLARSLERALKRRGLETIFDGHTAQALGLRQGREGPDSNCFGEPRRILGLCGEIHISNIVQMGQMEYSLKILCLIKLIDNNYGFAP